MVRRIVEKIEKNLGRRVVRLIIGIDTHPKGKANVIFYFRTEEEDNETGHKEKPQEIWLSRVEFLKLAILLVLASSYFEQTLKAGTRRSEREVKSLINRWGIAKVGMRKWLKEPD